MRSFAGILALVVGGMVLPSMASIHVRVVDAAGAGVSSAHVACVVPPSEPVVTDGAGRAVLPVDCARATCSAPGFVPGQAATTDDGLACVLRPAAIVTGAVPASACANGCVLRVSAVAPTSGDPVSLSLSAGGGPFTFDALVPGTYRLDIARDADHWNCGTPLGWLAPGRHHVEVTWREPATIHVRIIDQQEQPLAHVRLRAWSRLRGAGVADAEPPGSWQCAGPAPPDTQSDANGGAELQPLDPALEHLVVAGAWDAPGGLDVKVVTELPDTVLALTPRPPGRVRGRVLDDADHPVKGRVELVPFDDSIVAWLVRLLPPARLEDEPRTRGEFAFDPALPGDYHVAVRGAEILPLDTSRFTLASGSTRDLGVLRVPAGERFTVRVRDEQRRPVAGAEVVVDGESGLVVRRRATTDADGSATIRALPPGSSIRLLVTADGFAPFHVRTLGTRQSPFVVDLQRSAIVSGRVVDPSNEPVAGATVSCRVPRREPYADDVLPRPVKCGSDGAFTLARLPAGEVLLTASDPRFSSPEPVPVTVVPGEPQRDVVLRLEAPHSVHGRVLDEADRPVGGARVLARVWYSVGSSLDEPPLAETRSAGDGTFELPCTSCTQIAVVALAPGRGPASRRVEDVGQPLDLRLLRAARLVVKGPAPRPGLRGVSVEDGAGIARLAALDARGRAEFDDLAPGEGSAVLVSKGWNKRLALSLVAGETAEVELSIADSSIEGTVTVDGRPWPGAVIGAYHVDADEPYGVETTRDGGRYEMPLAPGEVIVTARAAGGAAAARIVLGDGERRRLDLDIQRVIADVRVTSEDDGTPVEQAFIAAKPLFAIPGCGGGGGALQQADEERPGFFSRGIQCDGFGVATAADGRGVLALPVPGRYEFTVRTADREPLMRTLEIVAGDNAVRLAIKRSARALRFRFPEGVQARILCRQGVTPLEARAPGEEPVCRAVPQGVIDAFVCFPKIGVTHLQATAPERGEVIVDVEPRRGGRLVIPTASTTCPTVVDAQGIDWCEPLGTVCTPAPSRVELPDVGPAWVLDGLPPGTYSVAVEGVRRKPVDVVGGGTVIAPESR